MKKIGSVCEHIPHRDAELDKAFRRAMASVSAVDMETVYRNTVLTPASRFWVSERRATEVMSMMMRGISIAYMTPARREMYEEIFKRFLALREKAPGASMAETVARVINSPAPQFYLSAKSAKVFLCRYRAAARGRLRPGKEGGNE